MSEAVKPLTRRDFVRGTLGAAAGVSVLNVSCAEEAQPRRSSRVVLVRNENAHRDDDTINGPVLKNMLEETLTRLTQQKTLSEAWLSLVKPEDTVGLVPTYGVSRYRNPNHTHEELYVAVEASLVAAGIAKDRIHNVQCNANLQRKCTALICLPAVKAHWLTGLGTVLKNYIMFSVQPSAYHNENNVKLGEIWNLPDVKGKTKLILVDALRPLCDKGPQPDPQYMWPYNGLLASVDPVALDTICLQIINNKRKELRGEPWPLSPPPFCVAAADERYHLGTSKMSEIELEKYGWAKDLLL